LIGNLFLNALANANYRLAVLTPSQKNPKKQTPFGLLGFFFTLRNEMMKEQTRKTIDRFDVVKNNEKRWTA
jgi:hypothetical protein